MSLLSLPSIMKLFDRPRPPFTENVAVGVVYLLLVTPGAVKASIVGLREASGNSSICFVVMVVDRTGASTWSMTASADTSTTCWTSPISREGSSVTT
jgi:hypothetical protein